MAKAPAKKVPRNIPETYQRQVAHGTNMLPSSYASAGKRPKAQRKQGKGSEKTLHEKEIIDIKMAYSYEKMLNLPVRETPMVLKQHSLL